MGYFTFSWVFAHRVVAVAGWGARATTHPTFR
jgi:hypothetical protein